jgi:NADH-quinone oxidoreductase subunit E
LNALQEKYPKEVETILAKYPADFKQAAVMPLLYLAQREQSFITKKSLDDIAALLEISTTEVASVVGFYSLYREDTGPKYHLQVCTDLPCALKGAETFLEQLCDNLALRVGEISADGVFVVEEVKCLAGCNRAPLFQVQSGEGLSYHENQTLTSALELVEQLRKSKKMERRP